MVVVKMVVRRTTRVERQLYADVEATKRRMKRRIVICSEA